MFLSPMTKFTQRRHHHGQGPWQSRMQGACLACRQPCAGVTRSPWVHVGMLHIPSGDQTRSGHAIQPHNKTSREKISAMLTQAGHAPAKAPQLGLGAQKGTQPACLCTDPPASLTAHSSLCRRTTYAWRRAAALRRHTSRTRKSPHNPAAPACRPPQLPHAVTPLALGIAAEPRQWEALAAAQPHAARCPG
jgi:hypothetical protein